MPDNWFALCALVLLLGLRHGFDADHLATIDGMTRLASARKAGFARYCGLLFSLGHGTVVVAIALAIGSLSERWAPPVWLDAFGAWVSIAFLLLLGLANLRAALFARTGPDGTVPLVAVKGHLLGALVDARNPWRVAAVGALFAVSFDTVSQSALFAVTASRFGGAWHALALGLLFMLGMVVTDAINGWWISRLIARADRVAVLASRVMGATVGGVSLLVAAWGIARLNSQALDHWGEGKEVLFGAGVVALVGVSYLAARALGRKTVTPPGAAA
jgi:high-affinity nickel-transport protein